MKQRIVIPENLEQAVAEAISECGHDSIFVLTDENTASTCWPLISSFFALKHAHLITIPASDAHKDLKSLVSVWQGLEQGNASRRSVLINLGGGMVTDLGGFAAATFKRGIDFINIPTTLLAMVDASVGGKTGINFNGLKNEVGVFCGAKTVILHTDFLRSLDRENLLSGYAEMLKHALMSDEKMWARHIDFDWNAPDYKELMELVRHSVRFKQHVVDNDPYETGLRKALNLGHTFGHAFEAFSIKHQEKPILHGYAVAYGLIPELYLSAKRFGFPTDRLQQTYSFIRDNYGTLPLSCNDYPELIELMHHDKKNIGRHIVCTLLGGIGDIKINQTVTEDEIKEALDFLREG